MRRRRLFSALLTAALAPAWLDQLPARAEEAPDAPIATREMKFAIPVDVPVGDPTQAEVRLYISDDLGETWRLHHRAKPPLEIFDFTAPADGEYWFHVRTADMAGAESPTGPMSPELRVVVDATPPKLELETERSADGSIVVRWQMADRYADPAAMKLTYRSASGGPAPRELVPLRSKKQGDDRNASGEVQWRPQDAGSVVVMAQVVDKAGNRALAESLVDEAVGPAAIDLPKTAAPGPRPSNMIGTPNFSGGGSLADRSSTSRRETPVMPTPVVAQSVASGTPTFAPNDFQTPLTAPTRSSVQQAVAPVAPLRDPSVPLMVNST